RAAAQGRTDRVGHGQAAGARCRPATGPRPARPVQCRADRRAARLRRGPGRPGGVPRQARAPLGAGGLSHARPPWPARGRLCAQPRVLPTRPGAAGLRRGDGSDLGRDRWQLPGLRLRSAAASAFLDRHGNRRRDVGQRRAHRLLGRQPRRRGCVPRRRARRRRPRQWRARPATVLSRRLLRRIRDRPGRPQHRGRLPPFRGRHPLMFQTILIANRGEIACRVIRTARRLGIRTVAVFSEADADAQHVRLADEAYPIGGPRPADSYLRGDAIVEVAVRAGAQAIHPGYGFLSENAEFADAAEAAGLAFIGPGAASMRKMGSKAGAKQLMRAAGVPVVPGYTGEDQSPELLAREAARIGFPLMIKAAHGGGGKGMRVVRSAAEFLPSLESCQREAANAFGRDRVLLERYIESPRHIEIQVFGDRHGNVIHLNERECSAQRRYQKVLEESPSPFLTPRLRAAMGEAAVLAARAIDYANAGTVEFIVDPAGDFYFMEINTRLQVEHPVT